MGAIGAAAFDQLMQSKGGRWTLLVAFFIAAFLGLTMIKEETARHQAAIAQREAALQLWIKECGKPIDECATAWDASYTLRDMYRERVSPN